MTKELPDSDQLLRSTAVGTDYPSPLVPSPETSVLGSIDIRVDARTNTGGAPNREMVRTGRIDEAEVQASLASYVSRDLDEQLWRQLEKTNGSVIIGPRGSGRRTAAINAISRFVGPNSIIQVAGRTHRLLEGLEFKPGFGYVLDATFIGEPAELASLQQVLSEVRSGHAYLVVIGRSGAVWNEMSSDLSLTWSRPTVVDIVAGRGLDDVAFEDFNRSVGAGSTMAEIVGLLDRIEAGRSAGLSDEEVLAQMPERVRSETREWFAQQTAIDSWILHATVAFFSGTSLNEFSDLHHELRCCISGTSVDEAGTSSSAERRSLSAELDDSRAEIQQHDVDMYGAVGARRHVRLKNEAAASVFVQEFWLAAPRSLRSGVVQWLTASWEVSEVAAAVMIDRLTTLAVDDADLWITVVDGWASVRTPVANQLAAIAIEQALLDEATRDLALALARSWAEVRRTDTARWMTAIFTFSGDAGLLQVKRTQRLFRDVVERAPQWVLPAWTRFSLACGRSEWAAAELVDAMGSLRVVLDADLDDAAFVLLDRWFVDDGSKPPLALVLSNSDRATSELSRIVASTINQSYRASRWLAALMPWADSTDNELAERALRLLRRSLIAVAPASAPDGAADSNAKRRQEHVIADLRLSLRPRRDPRYAASEVAAHRCHRLFDSITENQRTRGLHA